MLLNKHNLEIAKLVKDADRNSGSRIRTENVYVSPDYTAVTDGSMAVKVTTPKMSRDSYPDLADKGVPAVVDDFAPFHVPVETALKVLKGHPGGGRKTSIPILQCIGVALTANGDPALVTTDLEVHQVVPVKPDKNVSYVEDIDRVFRSPGEAMLTIHLDGKRLLALVQAAVKFLGNSRRDNEVVLKVGTFMSQRVLTLAAENSEGQTFSAAVMPLGSPAEEAYEAEQKRLANEQAAKATGEPMESPSPVEQPAEVAA
jgi:hypothetical protein